jgi:peptidoglycan/LPS O-acetylase OafA/YrhL
VQDYIGNHDLLSPASIAFLGITNLILFGQDMVLFLGADTSGHLYFTTNFWETSPGLYTFMAVPQAWTLSLELMFYVIAPFLVKRNIYALLSIISASLIIRFCIYFFGGLYHDPWTYRFFPTELAFFLAGTISYRLYLVIREKSFDNRIPTLATVFVVCITLGYQFIPGGFIKQWFYYGLVVLVMPLLFIFSNSYRLWDGRVGELSYPIYISHIFIIALLSPLLKSHLVSKHIGIIVCVATIIFSIILIRFVIDPIENYRRQRVKKASELLKHRD